MKIGFGIVLSVLAALAIVSVDSVMSLKDRAPSETYAKVQCDTGFATEWEIIRGRKMIKGGVIEFEMPNGEMFYRKMNNGEICTIVYKKEQ